MAHRHSLPKEKPIIKNRKGTLKRLWSYLAIQKGALMIVLLLVVVSSICGLLGPFLIGKVIDAYITTEQVTGLMKMLFWTGGVFAAYSLSSFLQNFWMIGLSQHAVFTLRIQLFEHLQKLPIPFFDQRQHGDLMSRVTNDIDNVSQTLNSAIIQITSSVLTLAGTLTVMVILSPTLTAVSLLIVPLMFFGMKWITKRTGKLFKEQQRNVGALNGFIQETIAGQKVVKSYSREDQMIAEFMDKSERLKEAGYWAQAYSGFIPKLMNMLNNVSFALIATAGGLLALNMHTTVGTIIIFTEYSRQFTRPLNDLANQFNTLLSAVAGAERVFDILDEEAEKDQVRIKESGKRIRGDIRFEDVSFGYDKDRRTIQGISFHAKPGDTVAIVGPTGAGKTTIINLLARFYDPQSGSIFIDGVKTVKIGREELRRDLGFVLQDSYIFQGTIRENIRYGNLEATDEEIVIAAKKANAHSFISKLQAGYETVLNQEGSGISQGQKQLLSIARAMVADPALLILDEATSNIDTVTEIKIQEGLQRLMNGRTSIVIAHRLNTIQNADQILVLNEGRIEEKGSHEELMEKHGFYSRLFQSQLQKQMMGMKKTSS